MNPSFKGVYSWILIIIAIVVLFNFFSNLKRSPIEKVGYSQFKKLVDEGRIKKAVISSGEISGEYYAEKKKENETKNETKQFKVTIPESSAGEIADILSNRGTNVDIKEEESNFLFNMFLNLLPILIIFILFIAIFKGISKGSNNVLSFGKSKAKLSAEKKKVTFQDVAGIEEAKEEVQEVVEFLKSPQKFQKLGGKIPKGVLLMGPPGTGKTLLARAIAGEAGVPFFLISGSDFVEVFVGVGASRVRDLFEQGKKSAPCILFIDEIDAVGRHRGAGIGSGHDEREQTLNQLLVEMDGFEGHDGVILIAATNRPDVLDSALLRPGRFDRQVVVTLPDIKGRGEILKVHSRNVPLAENVDLAVIARGTPGFSGAQLANLVNEAALNAAKYDRKEIAMADFEEAKDKVLMGKERKSMVMSEKEKRNTAYHEAGHALVAYMTPDADPLHKVTIIPRGMALGLTMILPEEDKFNYDKKDLQNQIAILLGGRLAEEIFLGNCTTGASNDLERVAELARNMVCKWGMSEELGPMAFGKVEEQIFLGKEIARRQDFSEATAMKIDQEIRKVVTKGHQEAKTLLENNKDLLKNLAEKLLEKETLNLPEVQEILGPRPVN